MPCGEGTCDARGGDCNKCEPGEKACDGDTVLTCNEAGQDYDASRCSGDMRCVGMGQCVACSSDDDCTELTNGCSVGMCGSDNRCVAEEAPARTPCRASNGRPGTCTNGTCECGQSSFAPAMIHIRIWSALAASNIPLGGMRIPHAGVASETFL
jgi:hypothetical protein